MNTLTGLETSAFEFESPFARETAESQPQELEQQAEDETRVSLRAQATRTSPSLATATIDGTKQGRFKADDGSASGVLAISRATFAVESPGGGSQASARRRYEPIMLTHSVGPSSPQFFAALVTNEVLTKVHIELYRSATSSDATPLYVIDLTNARVVRVRMVTQEDNPSQPQPRSGPQEEIAITFARIEVQSTAGRTVANDSWQSSQ